MGRVGEAEGVVEAEVGAVATVEEDEVSRGKHFAFRVGGVLYLVDIRINHTFADHRRCERVSIFGEVHYITFGKMLCSAHITAVV